MGDDTVSHRPKPCTSANSDRLTPSKLDSLRAHAKASQARMGEILAARRGRAGAAPDKQTTEPKTREWPRQLRASVRIGELSRELDRAAPGPAPEDTSHQREVISKAKALANAGIRVPTANRYEHLAGGRDAQAQRAGKAWLRPSGVKRQIDQKAAGPSVHGGQIARVDASAPSANCSQIPEARKVERGADLQKAVDPSLDRANLFSMGSAPVHDM